MSLKTSMFAKALKEKKNVRMMHFMTTLLKTIIKYT